MHAHSMTGQTDICSNVPNKLLSLKSFSEFCRVHQPENPTCQAPLYQFKKEKHLEIKFWFLLLCWHFKTFPRTSCSVLKKVPCGRGEIVLSKSRNSTGRLPARFCFVILKFSSEGVVSHFHGYKSRKFVQTQRELWAFISSFLLAAQL